MDGFYPFIYEPKIKKKDNFQTIPLYIELDLPPQNEEKINKNDNDEGIIIIEIL